MSDVIGVNVLLCKLMSEILAHGKGLTGPSPTTHVSQTKHKEIQASQKSAHETVGTEQL